MKFGIAFANIVSAVEGEGAVDLATIAEENGFESLWTVEHVVVPSGYESEYPYSPNGKMPGPEESPIPDPLIWLAYVAAVTTRIQLGTGILILPQRNPAVLAKECASLDRLSKGRLLLGIGVGWLREEFNALGVPWEARGARTDEYVAALRELWTEDESTFHGRFADFERAKSYPKPVRPGGIPVHVGGHSIAAARRAGRLGDGFFPGKGDVASLTELFAVMREAAVEAGRNPDAVELTAGGGMSLDNVKALADIGVDRFIIPPLAFDREGLKTSLGRFAADIIAKV